MNNNSKQEILSIRNNIRLLREALEGQKQEVDGYRARFQKVESKISNLKSRIRDLESNKITNFSSLLKILYNSHVRKSSSKSRD